MATHDFSKFLKLHVMKQWCINDLKKIIIRGAVPALQDSCDAPATGNLFTKQSSGISCTCGTKYETTRSLTSSLWKFGIHMASILIILHLKPWSIWNPNRSSCRLSIRSGEKVACHDSTGLGMDHPSRSWREAFFHLHGEKNELWTRQMM